MTTDDVAFDFMDELAPGCVAMFPSVGSVSFDRCPAQVLLSQLSLLKFFEYNETQQMAPWLASYFQVLSLRTGGLNYQTQYHQVARLVPTKLVFLVLTKLILV